MAQRKTKSPVHAGDGHTCGECAKGEWNTDCFNYRGKPFLIYCEYSTYARTRDGRGVCYDNTTACENFIVGKKGGIL